MQKCLGSREYNSCITLHLKSDFLLEIEHACDVVYDFLIMLSSVWSSPNVTMESSCLLSFIKTEALQLVLLFGSRQERSH